MFMFFITYYTINNDASSFVIEENPSLISNRYISTLSPQSLTNIHSDTRRTALNRVIRLKCFSK